MNLRLWMVTLCPLALIPIAALTAGHAEAADYGYYGDTGTDVVVQVSWTGSNCLGYTYPTDSGYGLTSDVICNTAGLGEVAYTANIGEYIGANPWETAGVWLTCHVWLNGVEAMYQAGYTVNCLSTLVP